VEIGYEKVKGQEKGLQTQGISPKGWHPCQGDEGISVNLQNQGQGQARQDAKGQAVL
ncbi:unnamed protein product, partial [marine sediment metagenome]